MNPWLSHSASTQLLYLCFYFETRSYQVTKLPNLDQTPASDSQSAGIHPHHYHYYCYFFFMYLFNYYNTNYFNKKKYIRNLSCFYGKKKKLYNLNSKICGITYTGMNFACASTQCWGLNPWPHRQQASTHHWATAPTP